MPRSPVKHRAAGGGRKPPGGTPPPPRPGAAGGGPQLSPDPPLSPNPVAVWPRVLRGVPGVVKEIRALDAKTLQISLVLPYAPLLTVLAHPAFSVVNVVPGDAGTTRWLG